MIVGRLCRDGMAAGRCVDERRSPRRVGCRGDRCGAVEEVDLYDSSARAHRVGGERQVDRPVDHRAGHGSGHDDHRRGADDDVDRRGIARTALVVDGSRADHVQARVPCLPRRDIGQHGGGSDRDRSIEEFHARDRTVRIARRGVECDARSGGKEGASDRRCQRHYRKPIVRDADRDGGRGRRAVPVVVRLGRQRIAASRHVRPRELVGRRRGRSEKRRASPVELDLGDRAVRIGRRRRERDAGARREGRTVRRRRERDRGRLVRCFHRCARRRRPGSRRRLRGYRIGRRFEQRPPRTVDRRPVAEAVGGPRAQAMRAVAQGRPLGEGRAPARGIDDGIAERDAVERRRHADALEVALAHVARLSVAGRADDEDGVRVRIGDGAAIRGAYEGERRFEAKRRDGDDVRRARGFDAAQEALRR